MVVRGVAHVQQGLGPGSNNDAEWLALIAAARLAVASGAADVVMLGDAAMVVHQANGVWPCRSDRLRAHREVFRALVADLPRWRVRKLARGQNLAGIALERRRWDLPFAGE